MPSVMLSKEAADELRTNLMDALGVGRNNANPEKPFRGPVAMEIDDATGNNMLAALNQAAAEGAPRDGAKGD
jgi:hypothetical protein